MHCIGSGSDILHCGEHWAIARWRLLYAHPHTEDKDTGDIAVSDEALSYCGEDGRGMGFKGLSCADTL